MSSIAEAMPARLRLLPAELRADAAVIQAVPS